MNKVKKSTDTNETKNINKPVNKKAWKIIGYCLLALPILWIVLTVVVPLAMGDGLGKYSGVQKNVAEGALLQPHMLIDNKMKWAYALHIKNVRAVSEQEKSGPYCENNTSDDPNSIKYYTVILEIRELFTFNTTTETHVGCDSREN